jgi:hypothetical protein
LAVVCELAGEENEDLDVDAAAPGLGLAGEVVEDDAVFPFLALAWLGVDRGVVFVKLRRRPWRARCGRRKTGGGEGNGGGER